MKINLFGPRELAPAPSIVAKVALALSLLTTGVACSVREPAAGGGTQSAEDSTGSASDRVLMCRERRLQSYDPSSSSQAMSPVRQLLAHQANQVLVPLLTSLQKESQNLVAALSALERAPTDAALLSAQQAWRSARVPWERSEGYLFGPVESLGVDPHLDSWPLSRVDLDRILNSQDQITADFVRQLGTDVQGFHTIEYLLFGDGETENTKAAEELTPKQAQYARAAGEVLAEWAEILLKAWTENHNPDDVCEPAYTALLQRPHLQNPFYSSEASALRELATSMTGIVVELAHTKMADPLGADVDSANSSLVESQFSWNSLADFAHNIESAAAIWTGQIGALESQTLGPGGLGVWVERFETGLGELVLHELKRSAEKLSEISGPNGLSYSQAIRDPDARLRAQQTIEQLKAVETLMNDRVLPLIAREAP
jgi:putative iron-regulated protein